MGAPLVATLKKFSFGAMSKRSPEPLLSTLDISEKKIRLFDFDKR